MKLRILGFVAALFFGISLAKADCKGWRVVERADDYTVVEHYHADDCVQTIQLTNYGNVYFLLAMPYGFDQILLNGVLPKHFPKRYLGKCCWLRRTKRGNKLVMTYGPTEPLNILQGN